MNRTIFPHTICNGSDSYARFPPKIMWDKNEGVPLSVKELPGMQDVQLTDEGAQSVWKGGETAAPFAAERSRSALPSSPATRDSHLVTCDS